MGFYHQEERDMAVPIGCLAIVIIALVAFFVIFITLDSQPYEGVSDGRELDGSHAGANAVVIPEE